MELNFLKIKKILARLKQKTTFALMCIVMKKAGFPIHISDQKFENSVDLLLVID